MLKQILRKAVTVLRWTTVIVSALALTLGGASAAERAFDSYAAGDQSAGAVSANAQILPGPPAPDEVPQNMTPSGKPNCEPYAYLSALLIGDFANFDNRVEADYDCPAVLPQVGQESCGRVAGRSTAFEVSPRLGIQFTLVGAKPSGTS